MMISPATPGPYLPRHRTFGINSSKSASRKHFRKLIPQESCSESRYRNLFYECLFYECLFYECLFYECLSSGACLRTWPIFDLENRTWPMFDFGKSNMADFRFGKSNMADFRFWKIEHGRFSILENRTWPMFGFR